MRLYSNLASPFGRKVKILAMETGLFERLEIRNVQTTAVAPDGALIGANPLGKIPCLELDDGSVLYDSRVICEFLDSLHESERLFPAAGPERFVALRHQALADGIMDAALLARYESFLRPEELRWPVWVDGQLAKVTRGLDLLEAEADQIAARLDIAAIAVGCALGYLDFRFAGMKWRQGRRRLAAWFEKLSERPSLQGTMPPI